MNAIDLQKLSSAVPVKTVDAAAKTKTEGSGEAGAFLKLLSSVSTEESGNLEQDTAGLLAEIEAAVAELQQLPPEELQPEQQELIASLVQLLAVYQQHTIEKPQERNLIRINFDPSHHIQPSIGAAELKTGAPIQEKLVQLVQQIAQKVQELNEVTTKEFVDVPIFMGGKKEYILSSPNKINGVLALLLATTEKLEAMPEQQRIATASKLESSAQELLKLFSGSIEEGEMPKDQKQLSPMPLFIRKNLEQFTGTKSTEAFGNPMGLSPIGTATLIEATTTGQTAPAPVIKSLATIKVDQPSPEISAATFESSKNDPAAPLATTNPLEASKAAPTPARQEIPLAPTSMVRLTNLADDLKQVISSSIKLTGIGETAQLKVSIFPEHLGHLDIRLSTVDGKIAAQILTSTPMAKEAMELQVYQLRNSLVQQGIQVDRIEITMQQAGQTLGQQQGQQEQRFARQQRQQTSSKNGYQQTGEEPSGIVRTSSSTADVMAVDYTI